MIILYFLFYSLAYTSTASAQIGSPTKNKNPYPAKYYNSTDEALVIKTVTYAPVYDNANGIYKKVLEPELKKLITEDKNWAYSDYKLAKNIRADEFDQNSSLVLEALDQSKADAMITCFVIKGPLGLTIQMNFFTKDGGALLIKEEFQDSKIFETEKVKTVLSQLYSSLKAKLPYSGFVTSRRGNQVTLNVGASQGLKKGDSLTVAQVLKINRHPKLNFMVGVEKEILGKVVLNRVEEEVSIGDITFEKEAGVIGQGSKLLPLNFVKYPNLASNDQILKDAYPNEKNPIEWLPAPTPQFGKFVFLAGFTDFSDDGVLATNRNIRSGNSLALTFTLGGEIWITPTTYGSVHLSQMSFKGSNDLPGSAPSKLNYSVSRMDAQFGYRYLITGDFWGPQIYTSFDYLSHNVRVSDSSPTAFTSFELSGFGLTAGGLFPITEKNDVHLGAQAKFLIFENFSETPVDSGKASPSFSEFSIYSTYQYTTNINLKGSMTFTNIQAKFDGGGNKSPQTRSLDEKINSYLFGIEYLF